MTTASFLHPQSSTILGASMGSSAREDGASSSDDQISIASIKPAITPESSPSPSTTSSMSSITTKRTRSKRRLSRTSDTLMAAILKLLGLNTANGGSKESQSKISSSINNGPNVLEKDMPTIPKAVKTSSIASESVGQQEKGQGNALLKQEPYSERSCLKNQNVIPHPPPKDANDHKPTNTGGSVEKKEIPHKRSVNDFRFGRLIGEGSFSTVYIAQDIHTGKEYAIKVCDKHHIIREKKQEYIRRERLVMNAMAGCPGFVNLFCTFQDARSLYFVMTFAKSGDLLPHINKVGSFDMACTRFYAAELVLALENMHQRGVIHRDLKPENILLDDNMHTLIADFGSAKLLAGENGANVEEPPPVQPQNSQHRSRKNSFVGTAQYVSPEILRGDASTFAIDLWALGCIIYQMISGLPPFRAGSEYLIFEKILKQDLTFPDGFDMDAKDLVEKLLVLDPSERIGAKDNQERYDSIRSHPFFEEIDWDSVHNQKPPQIYPYLPGLTQEEQDWRSNYRVPDHIEPGLDEKQLTRLLHQDLYFEEKPTTKKSSEPESLANISESEKRTRLELQKTDKWHQFADGELILKQGFINKRKGLFARKRMLLLTTGPRLIYIDPTQMVKKGEIPWSPELRVELKNFKIFFVHTPNRTYYLEDPEGYAWNWCEAMDDVRKFTYGESNERCNGGNS